MTAKAFLTGHSKKEKEAARKRGPSLKDKTKQLGEIARIRTLTLYEDPTHGFWHIAMHCPTGKSFPDISSLMNDYRRTGQQPVVQDVSGRRPARAPAISRKVSKPGQRRSARKAARAVRDIYDVPDDDDGETPCSASIADRSQSREPSLDEYTVEEAATMGEGITAGEVNTVGGTNTEEKASTAEGIDTAGETDAMGEVGVRVNMENTASWPNGMAGMEDTVFWEADAGKNVQGWDIGGPETGDPTLAWDSTDELNLTSLPVQHNNTKQQEAQQSETSRQWAWFALMQALVQQRQLYYSLW
ncbi:hypothetical protein V2A60_002370 [Cordyceps javanica]